MYENLKIEMMRKKSPKKKLLLFWEYTKVRFLKKCLPEVFRSKKFLKLKSFFRIMNLNICLKEPRMVSRGEGGERNG